MVRPRNGVLRKERAGRLLVGPSWPGHNTLREESGHLTHPQPNIWVPPSYLGQVETQAIGLAIEYLSQAFVK